MPEKSQIVAVLGERALLLPQLVSEALAANDRVKYLFTLLQNARYRAEHPDAEVSSLRSERLAAQIDDSELDEIVETTRAEGGGVFHLPHAARLLATITAQVERMLAPVELAAEPTAAPYAERLARLRTALPAAEDDRIHGREIAAMTAAQRQDGDSLHLLVMDLHKELHRLQSRVARQTLDGAHVYDLETDDVPRVRAFMAGVNATAPLKFDHPGLGTTATRSHGRLLLQNDIGTTDAHVLVVHVEARTVRVTYTDLHLERARFFCRLFEPFGVRWQEMRSRTTEGLAEGENYYLRTGELTAPDDEELDRFLRFLGSRIVFLIDWNKARKRLRQFVGKKEGIELLRWAAENDHGHRGFLMLGGEKLVYDAMELTAATPLRYGQRLDEVLGHDATLDFLRFVLRTTSRGLLEGRSPRLIRDEINVELSRHFQTAQQGLLTLSSRLATLIFEIGSRLHEGLLRSDEDGAAELRLGIAQRASRWESRADELVNEGRQLVRRAADGKVYLDLIEQADDAADNLEEGAFLLELLPTPIEPALLEPLCRLAGQTAQATQEFVRCVSLAALLERGGAREDVQDFLEAVDRVFNLEHTTDASERDLTRALVRSSCDFGRAHVVAQLAQNLESTVDALSRCSLKLRDHVLSEGAYS